MHLYVITRGIKHHVDQFITELQGKYLKMKYPNEKKELVDYNVQVGVRPIQLWEIVFPEEHKDLMMTTIMGQDGKTQHKKHEKFIWAIRKALGVQKIGKYNNTMIIPISRKDVAVTGVGIKKDYFENAKTGKRIYNRSLTEEEKKEYFEGL